SYAEPRGRAFADGENDRTITFRLRQHRDRESREQQSAGQGRNKDSKSRYASRPTPSVSHRPVSRLIVDAATLSSGVSQRPAQPAEPESENLRRRWSRRAKPWKKSRTNHIPK